MTQPDSTHLARVVIVIERNLHTTHMIGYLRTTFQVVVKSPAIGLWTQQDQWWLIVKCPKTCVAHIPQDGYLLTNIQLSFWSKFRQQFTFLTMAILIKIGKDITNIMFSIGALIRRSTKMWAKWASECSEFTKKNNPNARTCQGHVAPHNYVNW